MSSLLLTLANGWTAFSILATLSGIAGIALIALAVFGTTFLPSFIKQPLIIAGICLIVGGALYQAGQAKGAHLAFEQEASRALDAETKRADLAEAQNKQQAAQAAKDLAAEKADNAKLKELNDVLAKDKDRDRECVDGDVARRLRNL
ncbi:hypothetical protein ABID82_005125 [Methylobacterium sp. PvP062]|uniref:Uncharacterized protein n=1 Tax=Methylobacterium radiotolerans TaxID=31998 RepID=A0ABV2NU98_9HYPH|nr:MULTISPECIES: hypothetical protein [unclassified Methylobacterium]MBP2498439.1 hypothetical protein [Methylobacterium sp. PvP105]MBP2505618.1 hypothetical protein [Methylobacterium sp. PvP109]